jgi:2-dehydropantoate 2-reductase
MRIIIHGLGAIGGTIAARLALAGHEVVGIARGAQRAAIAADGLCLHAPDGSRRARFDCVGTPAELELRPDDAIILAVKSQDTPAAVAQLRAAGVADQPVFCAQNGVENERLALRHFANVHGMTVMLPAQYLTPGEVAVFGAPKPGVFDIGRYPGGLDAADEAMAAALEAAGFAAFLLPEVMRSKYGKLLMNLGNVVEAAFGRIPEAEAIRARLRDEAEAALAAAGIAWHAVGAGDPGREALLKIVEIEGIMRAGSSTTQSLARNTGSVETDYLNGEITLLARQHGTEAPANAWLAALAARMARDGLAPGSIPVAAFAAALRE